MSFPSVAYAPVRDWLGAGKDAPFYMKFLAGAITGGVGSVVGNPFDVLKVRKNVECYYSLMYLKKKKKYLLLAVGTCDEKLLEYL